MHEAASRSAAMAASDGDSLGRRRRRAHLVEARAAVHRPVVARREGHRRLAATLAADGCVVLAWPSGRSRALGGRPAAWTPLWVVLETLAHEEGLLASGEYELLGAIAAGQRPVLVHPLVEPPACPPRGVARLAPVRRPTGMHGRIRAQSRPGKPIDSRRSDRSRASFVRLGINASQGEHGPSRCAGAPPRQRPARVFSRPPRSAHRRS